MPLRRLIGVKPTPAGGGIVLASQEATMETMFWFYLGIAAIVFAALGGIALIIRAGRRDNKT